MSEFAQQILIGVDGGGTGCRAAIGTSSTGIIARAEGGPANVASDPDIAIKNVIATIDAAIQKANAPPSARRESARRETVVHLGLAGVMTPADGQRVAQALPYENVVVTDDRPTAVAGALGGADGFLLSVGTGTIIAANKGGVPRFLGGWGFQLSDQSSGAWLGRQMLEQVLLCHDRLADHSDLTRTVFAEFKNDPNAIVAFSLSAKPGHYGAFAPMVVAAAERGDVWGRALMARGADYLKRSLGVLGFRPGDMLCLSGGVGPHYATYLPADDLSGQIAPRGSALDGAFHLAKSSCHAVLRRKG